MFTMENCFYLLISQAMRYLRDPAVHPRDKQRMKQELSSELVWRDREGLWMESWGTGKELHGVLSGQSLGLGNSGLGAAWLHQTALFLLEHTAFQPLTLLPPGSPQLPCCWHPAFTPGKGHLCLQSQSRESGASDPAGAGFRPACAEIGPWHAVCLPLPPARTAVLGRGYSCNGCQPLRAAPITLSQVATTPTTFPLTLFLY
jgi:hypothetical protein